MGLSLRRNAIQSPQELSEKCPPTPLLSSLPLGGRPAAFPRRSAWKALSLKVSPGQLGGLGHADPLERLRAFRHGLRGAKGAFPRLRDSVARWVAAPWALWFCTAEPSSLETSEGAACRLARFGTRFGSPCAIQGIRVAESGTARLVCRSPFCAAGGGLRLLQRD